MARKGRTALQSRFFYVGSIFAVSFALVCFMYRFKTVNWILIVFGLAWVALVTAFAYEIVTRAQRLDAVVKVRTDALEESNRHLTALLDQLNASHAISYEINQKLEVSEICRAFADRLFQMAPGLEGVWLWLDRGLLAKAHDTPDEPCGAGPLELAAQAGQTFGMPPELNPLRPGNPLAARCFEARGVTVSHNLQDKAATWGWDWLASARAESFVGFPLQLGEALLGVLGVFGRHTISAEFVSQLHLSANQLSVALEKARLLKETQRRADQLAAANEELRQLDAMKDWFVSSVSHELRTPLTNIRSFGEILENYEDLSAEERREFASVIRLESERLTDLITDVLDVAKIDRGELKLQPAYFDLRPAVAQCCKLFAQDADERGIALVQSVQDDLPPVYADEGGVKRVLNNLLGNAFKFTADGGTVRVSAELGPAGPDGRPAVTVLVSDTGVGIPLKDQARIFERFTQLGSRPDDKPSGTGIGLAICREIVEQSHGDIWVQSRPGEGSTFGFTLPLAPAAA